MSKRLEVFGDRNGSLKPFEISEETKAVARLRTAEQLLLADPDASADELTEVLDMLGLGVTNTDHRATDRA